MIMRTTNSIYSILILSVLLVFSCKNESNQLTENPVWEKFKNGIENEDLTYLLNNSLDSIYCTDCILDVDNELHSKQLIFEKHRKNLYSSELLKGKTYSTHETDSIIRISYSFEKLSGNEASSIIYMFNRIENKYLFTGMITTP